MLLVLHIYKNKKQTKIAPVMSHLGSSCSKGIIARGSTTFNSILQNFTSMVFVKFLQHFTTSPPRPADLKQPQRKGNFAHRHTELKEMSG